MDIKAALAAGAKALGAWKGLAAAVRSESKCLRVRHCSAPACTLQALRQACLPRLSSRPWRLGTPMWWVWAATLRRGHENTHATACATHARADTRPLLTLAPPPAPSPLRPAPLARAKVVMENFADTAAVMAVLGLK